MEFILGLAFAYAIYYLFFRKKSYDIPVNITVTTEYRNEKYIDKDHDNWEGAFWDVASPRNIDANLHIKYKDGAGSTTQRNIRLMKYGAWDGGAILWAFCKLRNANRTFRTDRIISCTDLDTGEVIENLEAWLDAKYQASPDRAIEQIIDTAWDSVRVLFYVSKADGRITQKERAIMRDAIRSMNDHPELDDKRIDGLINSIDAPSLPAFKQAFGRIVKNNRILAEKITGYAEDMISTEKTISPAEQDAIDYMKKRLSKQSE